MTDLAVSHDELRPLMFSIAYRMLGSVGEAEDVVQEAFLRMHHAATKGSPAKSPEAYATTVTTRLAIDTLRSARKRRERYIGPWLPEPLLISNDDPADRAVAAETLSTAFLVVLETLSPLERAVFLLREVFGYGYDEIATVVQRTEANCRQLMARARRSLDDRRPRFEPSRERRDKLARQFFDACENGDVESLERLLAEDVVFHGDGGGKAPAVRKPVVGPTRVARFVLNLFGLGDRLHASTERVLVNGQPGARFTASDHVLGVMSLTIAGGRITAVQNVINPDKLRHLGPVGDLNELMRSTPE